MKQKKLTPVQRFWLMLKPDKYEIRNIYVYSLIIGLLNLSLPVGIQSIINLIQGGDISTSWIILTLLVALGIALSGVLQINQLRITENLQQKIFTRAAFEFAYRIPKIKLEQLLKVYAPELMNRFFDVVSVQKGVTKLLIDFSTAGIQVIFGLILLSLYHPFFIIFSLLLVLFIMIIFWITGKRGLATSLEESKHKYKTAHWLEELARANTTFKLSGVNHLALSRVNQNTSKYIDARESHFNVLRSQYKLMVVFKVIVAVGLLLIGGLLVIDQQMNIGQFVAAEIVILLIVNSVEKLTLSFETIYDVLTSLEKIGQVTDFELEKDGGLKTEPKKDGMQVTVGNVTYNYPGESRQTIKNISLEINPNDRVLVTGKNDSGKSTLIYLIGGLLSGFEGHVAIDDIPLSNYDYDDLHQRIGGYMRDENLFEGTLLENITLGREKATFDNVKWAVKNLNLEQLVCQLPEGYDTIIQSQGKQFSKSTVAKILIARAIVDKPRLLLLENSFSVFAPHEKQVILSFLLDREHLWTLILSSSEDLPKSPHFDKKIILEQGKIIQKN
ncbi:MAG: ATP-binding cassette domain-containing protein [Crocinitomicaceae bacterium]|nr:ATP-binding cassette domain-containing protein [Crocinitomicaceae bacterium]